MFLTAVIGPAFGVCGKMTSPRGSRLAGRSGEDMTLAPARADRYAQLETRLLDLPLPQPAPPIHRHRAHRAPAGDMSSCERSFQLSGPALALRNARGVMPVA